MRAPARPVLGRHRVTIEFLRRVLIPGGAGAYQQDVKEVTIQFGTKHGLSGRAAVQLAFDSVRAHQGRFTRFRILKWNGNQSQTMAETPPVQDVTKELLFETMWDGSRPSAGGGSQ